MTSQAGATQPLGESRLPDVATQWVLRQRALRQLCGPASFALLGGLAMCAVMLAARRCTSAAQPLEPALLPPTATVLALVAWLARRIGVIAGPQTSAFARAAPLLTTSASLILLGAALGAGVRSGWAALAYWALIASAEGWAWGRHFVERNSFRLFPARSLFRFFPERGPFRSADRPPPVPSERASAAAHRLTQQYTR
ncbi:MAG: hypothetical protein ACREJM_03600, partial [Candidatus Saccharimonadales bacterium]